jgi:hypothetical protein
MEMGVELPTGRRREIHRPTLRTIDDKFWPIAHFFINPADIFPKDANADQLDAAEKRHENHERGISPKNFPPHDLIKKVDRHQEKEKPAITNSGTFFSSLNTGTTTEISIRQS